MKGIHKYIENDVFSITYLRNQKQFSRYSKECSGPENNFVLNSSSRAKKITFA